MTLAAHAPNPTLDLPAEAASLLDQLRAERPRVHALTNAAAQALTANLLLAAGAVPSLTTAPEEVAAFVGGARALVVNLGTLDRDRREGIPLAVAAARRAGRPWVLDPVFAEASPSRLAFARELLAQGPTILRCNPSELAALSDGPTTPDAARPLARASRTVVALTGPTDHVTDGERVVELRNGHPLMARVTAMGCAATALLAAFAALQEDALVAAASALLAVGVAGEIAGEAARGPGSFVPEFLDALAALDGATLRERARIA